MAPLDDLVARITEQASRVSSLQGTSSTSGDKTYELQAARNDLATSALQLQHLAQDPADQILSQIYQMVNVSNLGAIVSLRIAQAVSDSSTPLSQLASTLNLPEDLLLRLLRISVANGLFTESEPKVFAHSPSSKLLAESESMRDVVTFLTSFGPRINSSIPAVLAEQQKNGKAVTAFEHANGMDIFAYMGQNPDFAGKYQRFLKGRAEFPRYSSTLLSGADSPLHGAKTVVDCGGGSGALSVFLAPHFPSTTFTTQDNSGTAIEQGNSTISASGSDLASRVSVEQHDFFTPQPRKADVYMYKHILHDWPDADCVRILRALVDGKLESGARVLVIEGMMPTGKGSVIGAFEGRQVLVEDAMMLAAHNARERSVEEYEKLFAESSKGFEFVKVHGEDKGDYLSAIEFVYRA